MAQAVNPRVVSFCCQLHVGKSKSLRFASSSGGGQTGGQARFFPTGGRAVDRAGFDSFVESRTKVTIRLRGIVLFAGADEFGKAAFESVQAGLDAPVMQTFARAGAHAAHG